MGEQHTFAGIGYVKTRRSFNGVTNYTEEYEGNGPGWLAVLCSCGSQFYDGNHSALLGKTVGSLIEVVNRHALEKLRADQSKTN